MLNSNHRIWNQQDFLEFYQEQPKIQTTPTYTTIQVLLEYQNLPNSEILDVKIPAAVSEQVYRFLIYKAIYFHFLDSKQENPLFQTAKIAFFEGQKDYREWYNIWLGRKGIKKGTLLKPVLYSSSQNITRYYPLAFIQKNNIFKSLLARSKKDGKYYEIVNFEHRTVENSEINRFHQGYVSLNHPFLSCLCEYHFTQSNSYFVFGHNPLKLSQVMKLELIKPNIGKIYFIETLLAVIYLEQQSFLSWNLDLSMIQIGKDGHIVISHKIISTVYSTEPKRKEGNKKWQVLQNLMKNLLQSNYTENTQDLELYQDFKDKLRTLCYQKKHSLKEVLKHQWLKRSKLNHILSKAMEIRICKRVFNQQEEFVPLKKEELAKIQSRFQLEAENTKYYCQYYKISEQTANQGILQKYFEESAENWSHQSHRSQKSRKKGCHLLLEAIEKNEESFGEGGKKSNLRIIEQEQKRKIIISSNLINRRKYKF